MNIHRELLCLLATLGVILCGIGLAESVLWAFLLGLGVVLFTLPELDKS
jgi:hypothetical protein